MYFRSIMIGRSGKYARTVPCSSLSSGKSFFCYPAGIWAKEQWPWLAETGIRSAVTCDKGFNYKKTPRYGLKRFGDDEHLSQIEFEAEVCGFTEIFRAMKRGFRFS